MGSGKHDTMQTTEVVRKNNKGEQEVESVADSCHASSRPTTQDQLPTPCPKAPDSSFGTKKATVTNK